MEKVKNTIEQEKNECYLRIHDLQQRILENPELEEDERKAAWDEYQSIYANLQELKKLGEFVEEYF